MRFTLRVIGLLLFMLASTTSSEGGQLINSDQTIPCNVTAPNGVLAGSDQIDRWGYGNQQISTSGIWADGTVVFKPGGAGFITRDGALGMKYPWWRGVRGRLTIEGRRLDAPAPPLRSEVNNGYGDIGFHASYVVFPTPGCWEVTGRVADASVTFVTRVVKIGDGPAWRRDSR